MRFRLLLILLCLCGFLCQETLAEGSRPLRVLTINVWSGSDYRGVWSFGEWESKATREQRFQVLVSQLRSIGPDVLFLQEATPVGRCASRLAKALDMDQIHQVCIAGIKFGPVGIPAGFKEGNVILARRGLHLFKVDEWKLSGGPGIYSDAVTVHFDETISSLVGGIIVDSAIVYLVNNHLRAAAWADEAISDSLAVLQRTGHISPVEYQSVLKQWKAGLALRRTEVHRLLDRLRRLPPKSPVIVAGDFNALPSSPEIGDLRSQGELHDTGQPDTSSQNVTWDPFHNTNTTFSYHTADARGHDLDLWNRLGSLGSSRAGRIDYVFLSKHFAQGDVLQYQVVLDTAVAGMYASDHYGVLADVSVTDALKGAPRQPESVTPPDHRKLNALPILMYDTDTGFGYGAKLFLLSFAKAGESLDLTVFNSSKGERWYRGVFSWPDRDLRQGKLYPLALDVTVDYDKWIKNSYFGIGSDSRFKDREFYTKESVDFNISLSRPFTSRLIGQLGVRYKTTRIDNFESGSRLLQLPPELHPARVRFASTVANLRFDTRDSSTNPSRGVVLQGEAEYSPKGRTGNVLFTRVLLSAQHYSVLFYPKAVLALRLLGQYLAGTDLPVQVSLPVGGGSTLRGSPQDRFLDKTAVVGNAEVRYPIYKRLGGTAAIDAGRVWGSLRQVSLRSWMTNPTVGLRFYMDAFVVRLDVGFGEETTGVCFNFGHAF